MKTGIIQKEESSGLTFNIYSPYESSPESPSEAAEVKTGVVAKGLPAIGEKTSSNTAQAKSFFVGTPSSEEGSPEPEAARLTLIKVNVTDDQGPLQEAARPADQTTTAAKAKSFFVESPSPDEGSPEAPTPQLTLLGTVSGEGNWVLEGPAPLHKMAPPEKTAIPPRKSGEDSGYSSISPASDLSPPSSPEEEFAVPVFDRSIAANISANNFTEESIDAINTYLRKNPRKFIQARGTGNIFFVHRNVSGLDRSMHITPEGDVVVHFTRHKPTTLADKEWSGTEKNVSLELSLRTGIISCTFGLKKDKDKKVLAKDEVANLIKYNGKKGFPGIISQYHYPKIVNGKIEIKDRVSQEYYNLGDLWKAIERGLLSKEDLMQITFQIEEALALLHVEDVHRDFKPQNILLKRNPDGSITAVISDLSSVCRQNDSLAFDGRCTTSWFASPEHAKKVMTLPPQYPKDFFMETDGMPNDIWSWGITLCFMYGIDVPWTSAKDEAMILSNIWWVMSEERVEYCFPTPTDKTSPQYAIRQILKHNPKERPSAEQRKALWANVDWDKWKQSP